jgi:LmbE family N-acetylglucosaminyl deacetylase
VEDAARLMAVMAHADDAEIWAGGTIVCHTAAGLPALVVILAGTDGDERGREAHAAACAMAAEVAFVGARDRFIEAEDRLVDRVARYMASFRPHYLITHWLGDSHPDHVATAQIARRAVLTAEAENDLQAMLACDTYLGWGLDGPFVPQLYVDVTAAWERKLAAIRFHASQDPQHYIDIIERQCWLHGARSLTTYAEAFRRMPFFGRTEAAQPWPPLWGGR